MKRFALTIVLMCGIIAMCIYSAYYVKQIEEKISTYANAIFIAIDEENPKMAKDGVNNLVGYWKEESPALARFVRHAHVDQVTLSIAKLEHFTKPDNFTDLSAELGVILWTMEDIWKSELPKLGNIL